MENKMMLPASCERMREEEMTYVVGGASESNEGICGGMFATGSVVGLAAAILSIGNMVWAIGTTRDWIHRNKTTTDNPVTDALDLAVKGVDDAISYASRSLWNAVVTVYTTMNLSTWWPVTAIAWITA